MQSKPTSVTFATTPPIVFTDGSPIPADAEILYKFNYKLSDAPWGTVLPAQAEPTVTVKTIEQRVDARILTAAVRCVVNGVESADSGVAQVEIPPLLLPEPPAVPSIDVVLN